LFAIVRSYFDVMKTFSLRITVMLGIIAIFMAFCPSAARATTVTVTVGNNCLCFSPDPVTIHPGDTVHWTWSSSGHSTTSGTSGSPNGLGILEFHNVWQRAVGRDRSSHAFACQHYRPGTARYR
jgi:plastocyanin